MIGIIGAIGLFVAYAATLCMAFVFLVRDDAQCDRILSAPKRCTECDSEIPACRAEMLHRKRIEVVEDAHVKEHVAYEEFWEEFSEWDERFAVCKEKRV